MKGIRLWFFIIKSICLLFCLAGSNAVAQKGPISGQADLNLGGLHSGAIGTTYTIPVNVNLDNVSAFSVDDLEVAAALGNYRIALSYDNTLIKAKLNNGYVLGGITPEFSTAVSANIITNGSSDTLVITQSQISGSTPVGLVNVAQIEFEILSGDGVTVTITPTILDLRTPISYIVANQELIGGIEIPNVITSASLDILPPIDTDGDGVPDMWEDLYAFLDPLNPTDAIVDTDGDGLTNLAEYQNATVPDNQDSDNDLVPDGAEVTAGMDPLDDTTYPLWIISVPDGAAITENFFQYTVEANKTPSMFSLLEFPAGMTIDSSGFISWSPSATQGGDFNVIIRATKETEVVDQDFMINVFYRGDVNADGVVDVADLLLVQRHVLGSISLTAEQIERVDLYPASGDGQITMQDSFLLIRLILGL